MTTRLVEFKIKEESDIGTRWEDLPANVAGLWAAYYAMMEREGRV
jgi:hypothetical protein